MKKIFITIVVCFSVINSYGQTEKKNLVGIHAAFGTGEFNYIRGYVGGGSYNTEYYYSTGIDYSRVLSKRLALSSGFEYTYSDMTVTPQPLGIPTSKMNLKLTTIPVLLKYNFWKFLYLNGGLFFNLSARTSDTWSIQTKYKGTMQAKYEETNKHDLFLGCGFGIGVEHEFSSGIILFFNPYVRLNGIENAEQTQSFLKFLKQGNIDMFQFLQGGVSLGIGYKF